MIGKAHLMVVILYLKVPDLIISVMNTRPWNINTSHKFFSLDCTTFEESVSYIIFNSSYFYESVPLEINKCPTKLHTKYMLH